jgi:hypothetical protein
MASVEETSNAKRFIADDGPCSELLLIIADEDVRRTSCSSPMGLCSEPRSLGVASEIEGWSFQRT